MTSFRDRQDAGRQLARELERYRGQPQALVLALPRGGVPVAYEVASHLRLPLDVLVVRKLGAPGFEEYAVGAIAAGTRVIHEDAVQALHITPEVLGSVARREERELIRREALYRAGRPAQDFTGQTVILVDDGLATGASMRAAVQAVRALGAARTVVAAPVGAPDTCAALTREADEVVCPLRPEPFRAVGLWYGRFDQTTDQEVLALLTGDQT